MDPSETDVPEELDSAADAASDRMTVLINEAQGDSIKLTGLAMASAAAAGVLTAAVTQGVEGARERMTEQLIEILRRASVAGGAAVTSQGMQN